MENIETIPISSLTHYVYCQRRCALVHTDQAWSENAFTVRGTMLHEKADTLEMELIEGIRVVRALSIWSDELGITGRADIVEFLRDGTPFPVEYKSGTKKKPLLNANGLDVLHLESDIQLCAQALCLEEMLHKEIPRGKVSK